MSKDWISVKRGLPVLAERVYIFHNGEGGVGKLTLYGWRDLNAMPIRNVTHWQAIVAPDETDE